MYLSVFAKFSVRSMCCFNNKKKNEKEAAEKHVGSREGLQTLSLDPWTGDAGSPRGWAAPGLEVDGSQRAASRTRRPTPPPGATLTAAVPDLTPAL